MSTILSHLSAAPLLSRDMGVRAAKREALPGEWYCLAAWGHDGPHVQEFVS